MGLHEHRMNRAGEQTMNEDEVVYFKYRSTSRIVTHTFAPKSGVGRSLTYKVVFLEPSFESVLTFGRGNRVRFVGELEGIPLRGTWQSPPGKGHYAMLSGALLKQAGCKVGDEAMLAFNVVSDTHVDVPEDIACACTATKTLASAWAGLTPGAQRAQIAQIDSAKTEPTRAKRIKNLVLLLRSS